MTQMIRHVSEVEKANLGKGYFCGLITNNFEDLKIGLSDDGS